MVKPVKARRFSYARVQGYEVIISRKDFGKGTSSPYRKEKKGGKV